LPPGLRLGHPAESQAGWGGTIWLRKRGGVTQAFEGAPVAAWPEAGAPSWKPGRLRWNHMATQI